VNTFEYGLRQHEEERHRGILGRLAQLARSRRRVPWLETDDEGYMPAADAARVMGTSTATVQSLARAGYLDYRTEGSRVLIRPAVLSIVGIEDIRP
jgi:hypothetical protein